MTHLKPYSKIVGTGICHACGKKVAKIYCFCLECEEKHTHEEFGLDFRRCDLKLLDFQNVKNRTNFATD